MRAFLRSSAAQAKILHQRGVDFGANESILPHCGVFPFLEPKRRAPDETTFQLLRIAGILQTQPLQRRLHRLDPPREQVAQQIRYPTPVDAADAPVDEGAEITQDHTLGQQEFEAVGGHASQRSGQSKPAVQQNCGAEGPAIGNTPT